MKRPAGGTTRIARRCTGDGERGAQCVLVWGETAAHLAAELADGLLHVVHLLPVAERLVDLGHVQAEVGHIGVAALAVQDHLRDDRLNEHPVVLSVGSVQPDRRVSEDEQLANVVRRVPAFSMHAFAAGAPG